MSEEGTMSIVKHVGDRIRELRTGYKGRKLSQEELARELGIATNTISRWETGTYRPSIEDLEMLARFFDIAISEFFPQEAPPPRDTRLNALLRGAKNLNDDDLSDVQRYLDFVQTRTAYERPRRKSQGRK
jgi:transcriptional regulator with XRE-family HTH domain